MSLLLLLLGLPAGLHAQDSLYTITGRVLDEKNEALLGASVSLLQSDGKLKTGAITAKDESPPEATPCVSPSSGTRPTPPPSVSRSNHSRCPPSPSKLRVKSSKA